MDWSDNIITATAVTPSEYTYMYSHNHWPTTKQ